MPCDYKNYPADWKTNIRPRILERDGHKCKFCGAPNYSVIIRYTDSFEVVPNSMYAEALTTDGFKMVKIVLTVAHLDHDTNNNDDENLAALCQRCHLRHDAEQHARSRRRQPKNQTALEL